MCPLETQARIIRKSTPRFAKQLSHKYSQNNATAVCRDLEENHHRKVAKSFVQNLVDWVGGIASAKEEHWEYAIPDFGNEVATVGVSLDGAHILMQQEGWREAMVGTPSLYDAQGDRLHTTYIGESPGYGKGTSKARFDRELGRVKSFYPNALYLGIADGAADFWSFLNPRTDQQLLDFYHVTEYLGKVAYAAHPEKTGKPARKRWMDEHCHRLKHEPGYVEVIIQEMEKLSGKKKLSNPIRSDLAACKTLVKQRLCNSGMRWKSQGAKIVLTLRGLVQSGNRWQQFWDKIDQYGLQKAVN